MLQRLLAGGGIWGYRLKKAVVIAMLPRSLVKSFGLRVAVLGQCGPFLPLVFVVVALLISGVAKAQTPAPESNYDRRTSTAQATGLALATATREQARALATLRGALSGSLQSSLDRRTGVTRSLYNPLGYLTGAAAGEPARIADDFLRGNPALIGLEAGDLDDHEVTDTVFSAVSGVTHIYLRQRYLGLPIYNAQLQVHVTRDGRISGITNGFVPGLAKLRKLAVPVTSAADAVASAAAHLGTPLRSRPRLMAPPAGARQLTSVSAASLSSRPVDAELMWLPIGRDLQLVWRFQVHTPDAQHIYDMTVDAEGGALDPTDGGRVFTRFDWVTSSEYRVYEQPVESPNHTSPSPPADARTLAVNPEDATASPLGWHDSGTTLMDGNNVHAYLDRNGNNLPDSPQATCTGTLQCDFPLNLGLDPANSTAAAVANLFYWNNLIHDVQYQYGFDEAGGNFQENNFGRGGLGSDSVNAEAQDNANGTSRCNANFATPTDGGNPRMQMFVCNNASPQRDGDLDNGVIVHEYGHGISIRQVGGPGNSSCLNNAQQPGEGWSDWFALAYTAEPGDAGPDPRGIGTYLFGLAANGPGIRPQRYSTDPAINNYTYQSINGLSIPHGVGSVWAQAIWEVYWALVDAYGFDPDLYSAMGGAGNQRALLYVNEGLKNTACSPTFLDARDGIIQAANSFFGGQDVCLLWQSFAAFGLGADAVSGGPNSTAPTNGFQLPAACAAPPLPPPACPAGSIDFTAFPLEAYSNQDGAGTVSVESNGNVLFMEGNRWRRSAQSFQVTPDTVIDFFYQSGEQGEIHGIGFDEDQTLTNATRIFEFWGTQNWGGAFQHAPRYSGSGGYESFSIPVGQFYSGNAMRLVFVNDKDAGAATNLGRFACVRVSREPPPGCGTVLHTTDFESGANGWSHSAAQSSCTTGSWLVGDPNAVVSGGVTTQLGDDHTAAGVNAFFTQPNISAGRDDVDNGVCTALSPTIDARGFGSVDVTLWYYHGQRDAGDDPGDDFFRIDLSNDGGASYTTNLVSIGDVTSNAAWTQVMRTVTNPDQLKVRVQAADGAGPGDLVEAGLDDVLVCAPQ